MYHGTIERKSKGDLQVAAGGRKIDLPPKVASGAASSDEKVGEEVLAVVPINAAEASTIYPVRQADAR